MQTRDEVLAACLELPGTFADQPFRDDNRKVFAWVFEREGRVWVNLKCDPEWRDALRQRFDAVVPAYHLNKVHWNSVILDGTVPDDDVRSMIAETAELNNETPEAAPRPQARRLALA